MEKQNSFGELFKKYRLKSEIPTLSKFGHILSEKGFNYEDSIFSHWQKGGREPQNRFIILKLIEIFSERKAIITINEANGFLSSLNQGYLTEKELEKFKFETSTQTPFQVPNQIANFTGRKEILVKLKKQIKKNNIFLFHGLAGVGKTALAIQAAHLLKKEFPDGVLWFRLDTSDVMDILLGIAYSFGKDVSNILDREIRASSVRSLLTNKRVLLVFDNVEPKTDINLLIPNTKGCLIIITSRNSVLNIPEEYKTIVIPEFNREEILSLFKGILGVSYLNKHQAEIFRLSYIVGNLPLALHILAREIKRGSISITELIDRINQDPSYLEGLSYENKNLSLALEVSLSLLNGLAKKVFISLAVFNGKDFSIEAVAFINDLSLPDTKKILKNLQSTSLIEESTNNRYRIHPMIKKFIRLKLNDPKLFLKAAKYYQTYLSQFDKTRLKSYPNIKQESDNVLYIFKKCYELAFWNEVIVLWNPLENLLYATNQLNKMRYVYQIAKNQTKGINVYQKISLIYFCYLFFYWIILQITGSKTNFWNLFYSFSIALMPFIGGFTGFFIAKSWGLFKSSIGKSVFFLSAGLVSWGSGNMIWAYYNFFLNDEVPYPSLAEIGFLPSYLLWATGMVHLPHAIGGESNFRKKYGKLLLLIPFFILAFSYYLVTFITKSSLVFAPFTSYAKLFFDIAYPAGDAIILTAAFLVGISFKFFGGKYRLSIYTLILGFCFLYLGDFLFSYTTTTSTYYNGGLVDKAFATGLFFLTFGTLGFYFKPEKKV